MDPRKLILALSVISILWISAPASAQQKPANAELVARLERMASGTEWKTRTLTGAPQQKWLLHQARVRRLIERLNSGQSVDPKEIDEALKEHSR
jgi:hypothetical protein